ncbi:hypothetical protein U9M48_043994 [Paspalum notatum var. saurae]|uniref:non-specific serine/threonine protein kinase n=1 Tax=Paspalum notatum var. saurae TaxID=547442 RepID=A0AAQ3UUK5_PASNO
MARASALGCATLVLALVAAHVSLLVRAQDTIAAGWPLSGDAKLVSRGGKFALGFFQPDGGVSGSWYVGIWYNNTAVRTPVWVANRDRPVSDPAASRLTIAADGNLAVLDASGSAINNATVAVLLDTGNLVLAAASNVSDVLWQSFDHIGDTWLPGGKLRRDKQVTSVIQGMTSWRARGDPAPGMYMLQLDPGRAEVRAAVERHPGGREYWLTGDWNGRYFTGASGGSSGYSFQFVDNAREAYFAYNFADNSTVYRFVTDVSGQVKGWFWVEALQQWNQVQRSASAPGTRPPPPAPKPGNGGPKPDFMVWFFFRPEWSGEIWAKKKAHGMVWLRLRNEMAWFRYSCGLNGWPLRFYTAVSTNHRSGPRALSRRRHQLAAAIAPPSSSSPPSPQPSSSPPPAPPAASILIVRKTMMARRTKKVQAGLTTAEGRVTGFKY